MLTLAVGAIDYLFVLAVSAIDYLLVLAVGAIDYLLTLAVGATVVGCAVALVDSRVTINVRAGASVHAGTDATSWVLNSC